MKYLFGVGGGGDAICATRIAGGKRSIVASVIWEKYTLDPQPGPRAPSELTCVKGLSSLGHAQVSSHTRLPNGNQPTLAVLANQFPEIAFIGLDVSNGVSGIADQLREIQRIYPGSQDWEGVDVGGDVLASLPSDQLRSPLLDAIGLGALFQVSPKSVIHVAGIGLDGEIDPLNALNACKSLGATRSQKREIDIDKLIWRLIKCRQLHSDVNALFIASLMGFRGKVIARVQQQAVEVSSQQSAIWTCEIERLYRHNRLSQILAETTSLEQGSQLCMDNSYCSELNYERRIIPKIFANQSPLERISDGSLSVNLQLINQQYPEADFCSDRVLAYLCNTTVASIEHALRRYAAARCEWWPFVNIQT